MSTASTVTAMLSLLERMSFNTAEFSSLLNSAKFAFVKPEKETEIMKDVLTMSQ